MKPTRIALVLMVFLGTSVQAIAQLSNSAPITHETSLDIRASFEALGAKTGLNVITPRALTPAGVVPFKVENKSVIEALDLLARQTSSFWTRWDDKTILVFPDTAQNRRDFERISLRRIAVERLPDDVVRDLRNNQQMRGVAGSRNAILLRDTAPRIKLAEEVLGRTSSPVGDGNLESIYLAEIRPYSTPASVRSQLNIKTPSRVSLNVNQTSRATFETLALMGGVNLVFSGNYPGRSHSFRIDDADFFDALDLLAIETGSFWQPINETTIQVLEDTQQNRRDFEGHIAETIYLPAVTSTQELNTIMNTLRTMLSLRGVYQNEAARAIFVHDTAANIAVVETLIAEMSGSPVRKEMTSGVLDPFSETGSHARTAADVRSSLRMKSAGRISLRMNAPASEIFAHLATLAGLDLLLSPSVRNAQIAFQVEGLDIIDTLDLLAFQTGTFWQPLDSRTIQVLEDTQQNRRDYATRIVKTIYLPVATSTQEMNSMMNVLRTALSLRGIYQSESAKAILIADTPSRVALAEKIVNQLNTHPSPVTSVIIPMRGVSETAIRSVAPIARADLRTATTGPVSISLNQDARASYEALAQIAGLRVLFDPRITTTGPVAFRLEGADVLDALDYLSLQTRTFWKPVDDRTILVAPDTQQAHAELDSQVSKIFYLANATSAGAANGLINVLRTALGLRQVVEQSPGVLAVSDTPQRLALVERVIAALDKAR